MTTKKTLQFELKAPNIWGVVVRHPGHRAKGNTPYTIQVRYRICLEGGRYKADYSPGSFPFGNIGPFLSGYPTLEEAKAKCQAHHNSYCKKGATA